jgi:hypothetical protein
MHSIFELEITLNGISPTIWRRVIVKSNTNLLDLHYVIQFAMGWTNSHLHHFTYGNQDEFISYRQWAEDEFGEMTYTESSNVILSKILRSPGDAMTYLYDFGDYWEHQVTLCQITNTTPATHLPFLIGGQRACPPEDCGNTRGYQEMIMALKRPNSKDAKEYYDWLGYKYSPEAFDPDFINKVYFKNFKKVMKQWHDYANHSDDPDYKEFTDAFIRDWAGFVRFL